MAPGLADIGGLNVMAKFRACVWGVDLNVGALLGNSWLDPYRIEVNSAVNKSLKANLVSD